MHSEILVKGCGILNCKNRQKTCKKSNWILSISLGLQNLLIKCKGANAIFLIALAWSTTSRSSVQDFQAIDLLDRNIVEFSILDNPNNARFWFIKQLHDIDPVRNPIPWVRACWMVAYLLEDDDLPLIKDNIQQCIDVSLQHGLFLEWATLRYSVEFMRRETDKFDEFTRSVDKLIAEIRETKDADALGFVLAQMALEMLEMRIVDKSLPYLTEANSLIDSGASKSLLVYDQTKNALSSSFEYRDLRPESLAVDDSMVLLYRNRGIRKSLATALYNREFSRMKLGVSNGVEAQSNYMEALNLAKLVGNDFIEGTSLYALGLLSVQNQQYDEAEKQTRQARDIFVKLKMSHWIMVCDMFLAEIMIAKKNFISALQLIDAIEKNLPKDEQLRQGTIAMFRYKAYFGLNDLRNAIRYLEQYQKIADDLARKKEKESYNRAAASIGLQLEQEKSKSLEKENKLHVQELKEAKRFRRFVIILGILSLSILGLLVLAFLQIGRIQASKRKMQIILDNIDEGLLTVDRNRKIGRDYSKFLTILLGDSTVIEGEDFTSTIFHSSKMPTEQVAIIDQVLQATFAEEPLVWEMNSENLSREVRMGSKGDQIIALRWIPIFNRQNTMETLLVSLADITQARILEEALGAQEKRLRSLPDALRELLQTKPTLTNQVLAQTAEILHQYEKHDDAQKFLRELHTQKGAARALGLRKLSQDLHELESSLKASKGLELDKKKYLEVASEQIREYQSFALILQQNSQVDAILDQNLLAAIAPLFKVWTDQLRQADIPLEKIRVTDGFFSWAEEDLSLAKAICLHGINNSLDHGFIFPKQRGEYLEKAVIEITATGEKESLYIEIRDNGVGLNCKKIEALAEARNFIPGEGESIQDVLFQDGVTTAGEVTLTSGRGVGLAAVKARILERGGIIRIQNNEQGLGTILWARIPLIRVEA